MTARVTIREVSLAPSHAPLRTSPPGFTLIELLVVVVVIAVLVGLAVPGLAAARKSSQRSADLATTRQLFTAVMLYTADFRDSFPFLGTPGEPFTPIKIDGVPISGQHFQLHRWFWASVVVPHYFDADRSAVMGRGVPQGLDRRGLPPGAVASLYEMPACAFAAPPFWRDGSDWLRTEYVRSTLTSDVRTPDRKGLLTRQLSMQLNPPHDSPDPVTAVGLADGSARTVDLRTLPRPAIARRPWGATGAPIDSTEGGMSGRDIE